MMDELTWDDFFVVYAEMPLFFLLGHRIVLQILEVIVKVIVAVKMMILMFKLKIENGKTLLI